MAKERKRIRRSERSPLNGCKFISRNNPLINKTISRIDMDNYFGCFMYPENEEELNKKLRKRFRDSL